MNLEDGVPFTSGTYPRMCIEFGVEGFETEERE